MRLHAAIHGLLACLVGLAGAQGTDEPGKVGGGPQGAGTTSSEPNSVVWVIGSSAPLNSSKGVQSLAADGFTLRFAFDHVSDVEITTAKLRRYNITGTPDGSDDDEIAEALISPPSTADSDTPPLQKGSMITQIFLKDGNTNVNINWASDQAKQGLDKYLNRALYLECEWQAQSGGAHGKSRTQVFAVFTTDWDAAFRNVNAAVEHSSLGAPARQEDPLVPNPDGSPTVTATPGSTNSPTGVASGPTPTALEPGSAGLEPPQKTPTGLNRNAIIGIAVGVGGGVLVIAGLLLWLLCARRRQDKDGANASSPHRLHNAMHSYGSDEGGDMHGMMHDKEMPVVMESARPSVDPYAPYSDRASTPPSPEHQNQQRQHVYQPMQTHAQTAPVSPVVASPVVTRGSRPELSRNAATSATTTTTLRNTTYAHLVEEGMTPEEIRRLEEEERQLDAEIENAGRRGL